MKKNFLGLAAIPMLALLATSCAQETVETKGGDNVLTYGVATGKQTLSRATEVTTETLTEFTVAAYYTTGESFGDFTVVETTDPEFTTGWAYNEDGPVYHPSEELSHYANNSGVTFEIGDDASEATFDYTVPAEGQNDLIVAAATTTATSATAALTFNHPLAQIRFAVAEKDGVDIEIVNDVINVNDVFDTGTYTLTNGNAGTWAAEKTGVADYASALTAFTPTEEEAYVFTGNSLMLMPQTFTGDGNFSFSYKLYEGSTLIAEDDAEADFSGAWVAGTKYLYIIGFNELNKLQYNVVEVNEWPDETPGGTINF